MNAPARTRITDGLCTTCNDAGTCMYLVRAEVPIWRCEEFDDGSRAVRPTLHLAVEVDEQPPTVAVAGICSNCDNLDGCTFDKAEGGVWHCEEYR